MSECILIERQLQAKKSEPVRPKNTPFDFWSCQLHDPLMGGRTPPAPMADLPCG